MKRTTKAIAILLAVIMLCCTGMTAFAAVKDNVTYSITWVYENETIVDRYHEGDTIQVREATLSDGSIGGWSTDSSAEKAPMQSPVPETMPAQDLTFYAKKSFVSGITDVIIGSLQDKFLSKEFWQAQSPLFWVFPYIWYQIVFFFSNLC